ncbi:MAG: Ribonuclease R [Phycisphaerae bacterium]|nr:Ribonuclease R [Phycisphaerae bacterium]
MSRRRPPRGEDQPITAGGPDSVRNAWRNSIIHYIGNHPSRPLKCRALARELGVADADYTHFRDLVHRLTADGTLHLGSGRTLTLPDARADLVGTLHLDRRGFGFIDRPGLPGVYVPPAGLSDARHGDTVSARLVRSSVRRGARTAEILAVIRRAERRWVGVLARHGRRWLVTPSGSSPVSAIDVDDPAALGAREHDLVVVEPLGRANTDLVARGVIVERLGPSTDVAVAMRGVLRRYGVNEPFPPDALDEARQAAAEWSNDAFDDRDDLRGLLTITIDPPDARDFDDAISIERVDGSLELGVHIADVARFVPPGSALDAEAARRCNSVYLPGYVVPMLPPLLSNGICSLHEGQPRLTRSALLRYDAEGHVRAVRFANSVICSARRLTYEQAAEILAGRLRDCDPRIAALLREAETLARQIQRRRFADGMLSLNLPEVQLEFDPHGAVIDAHPAESGFPHTIIEMFMVEANEAVCRALAEVDVPHLRRVHPPPDPESDERLAHRLAALTLHPRRSLDRAALQRAIESARGKPLETAVNYTILRALPQAAYSTEPVGHFALASRDYCHFTSPIRRYPDLTIHRLLDLHIRGVIEQRSVRRELPTAAHLQSVAAQCNAAERRAQQAERDARSMLLVRFMESKVGQTFSGVVTGVTSIGVFVQIQPFMAEGLIRTARLRDGPWRHDLKLGRLTSARATRVISIGQSVRVGVTAVDTIRQWIELEPAGPLGEASDEKDVRRHKVRKPRGRRR